MHAVCIECVGILNAPLFSIIMHLGRAAYLDYAAAAEEVQKSQEMFKFDFFLQIWHASVDQ